MTMPKNYLKQVYLKNEPFLSYVALRICFLTHLVEGEECLGQVYIVYNWHDIGLSV